MPPSPGANTPKPNPHHQIHLQIPRTVPSTDTIPGTTLPVYAHRLILFFTTALHRHDMIFTVTHRHHVEQWVELVVRLYWYDTTPAACHQTYKLLQPHHTTVWKNALAVMSFEHLIRNTQAAKMAAFEQQLETDWRTLTQDIRARGKRPATRTTTNRDTRTTRSNARKKRRTERTNLAKKKPL